MKKQSVFKLLTATLAVAAAFGGFAALDTQTANASTNKFEMDTVAAVRVDKQGVRFYANFDEATYTEIQKTNVGYGFLVFPQEYLNVGETNEITGDYHNKNNIPQYVEITGDENKIYSYGDGYRANAVITEVLTTSFDIPFTCVAYLKTTDETSGAVTYKYADFDKTFSRSSYQVASAAYIKEADKRETLLTTYKTKYGFGMDTMPVLIQDYKDLELISAAVTNEETTFEGVQFILNNDITLRNSYAPIPTAFEGTIDGNDKTVTANFEVALVEGAEDLTGTIVENPVIPTKLVDVAIEPELISRATGSQKKELVTKDDYTADGITGDYTGNALKFYGDELGTTQLKYYLTVPEYSETEIETLKNTYDYVTMWLAKAGAGAAFGGLYNNTQTSAQDYSFDYNTWYKYSIGIEDYFALVATYTSPYIVYTWQEKTESPNAIMYIGDISFEENNVDTTAVVRINNETTAFNATTVATQEYKSAEEINLSGNYSGNAIKFTTTKQTNSMNFYMSVPAYTQRQINEIKTTYTHVSFWFALNDYGTPFQGLYNNLATSTNYSSKFGARNEWHQFTITVEQYFAYIEANKTDSGNVLLIYIYVSDKTTSPNVELYVGDIEFTTSFYPLLRAESWDGSGQKDTTNYDGNGAPLFHDYYYSRFTSAATLANEGFGNNVYSGNALQFKWGTASTASYNNYVKMTTIISDEQFKSIAARYNTVRFYMGIDDQGATQEGWSCTVGGGILNKAKQTSQYGETTDKGYTFTASDNLNWVEFTISITDFIEYMNGTTPVDAFKRLECNGQNFYLYISEFEFVNTAA